MSKKDEFNIYRDIFGVKDRDFNGDVDWRDCEIEREELERIMKSKSISDYNDDVDDYDILILLKTFLMILTMRKMNRIMTIMKK